MGEILEGVINETKNSINPAKITSTNISAYFRSTRTEIVLCLLPSGADKAVKFYTEGALKARCAFINATPTNIANDRDIAEKYSKTNLPLIGDD